VGKVVNRHKVGKHFSLHMADGVFRWERDETSIAQEAALDGIYVIRTSEPKKRLSAQDTVRSYKNLGQVEQVFRCLKGIDIRVRPIHHREGPRVRAHVFLCLLAYYVEWHMRRALSSLLFDELGTLCRNRCRIQADPSGSTFTQETQPTRLQARAFEFSSL
jgi:transposase